MNLNDICVPVSIVMAAIIVFLIASLRKQIRRAEYWKSYVAGGIDALDRAYDDAVARCDAQFAAKLKVIRDTEDTALTVAIHNEAIL